MVTNVSAGPDHACGRRATPHRLITRATGRHGCGFQPTRAATSGRRPDDPEYRGLHADLLGFVDEVRKHAVNGRAIRASMLPSEVSEPVELGLGYAAGTKRGSALGSDTIDGIVRTFQQVPQLQSTDLDIPAIWGRTAAGRDLCCTSSSCVGVRLAASLR
jgi:hypothetical protein